MQSKLQTSLLTLSKRRSTVTLLMVAVMAIGLSAHAADAVAPAKKKASAAKTYNKAGSKKLTPQKASTEDKIIAKSGTGPVPPGDDLKATNKPKQR